MGLVEKVHLAIQSPATTYIRCMLEASVVSAVSSCLTLRGSVIDCTICFFIMASFSFRISSRTMNSAEGSLFFSKLWL